MSTKPNAEELPFVRPSAIYDDAWVVETSGIIGYDQMFDTEASAKAAAVLIANIRKADAKVYNPIADERDELREALEKIVIEADFKERVAGGLGHFEDATKFARAILAKYPKP